MCCLSSQTLHDSTPPLVFMFDPELPLLIWPFRNWGVPSVAFVTSCRVSACRALIVLLALYYKSDKWHQCRYGSKSATIRSGLCQQAACTVLPAWLPHSIFDLNYPSWHHYLGNESALVAHPVPTHRQPTAGTVCSRYISEDQFYAKEINTSIIKQLYYLIFTPKLSN